MRALADGEALGMDRPLALAVPAAARVLVEGGEGGVLEGALPARAVAGLVTRCKRRAEDGDMGRTHWTKMSGSGSHGRASAHEYAMVSGAAAASRSACP